MKPHLLLFLLILAWGFAGCGKSPRQAAEERVRKVVATTLRRDAAVLYKNIFAASGPKFISIDPRVWPKSFADMEPERVSAYRDGFALVMTPEVEGESGVYVIPEGFPQTPAETSRATFERLADGVFWYEFGPGAGE